MARANAIAAKVRSLHGEQLDERDYAELLSRRNVPEIAAYLKNETHYILLPLLPLPNTTLPRGLFLLI